MERGALGEDIVQKMRVRIGEDKEEKSIDISVTGREYTSEELKEAFTRAAEKLEKYIMGENKSPDEIRCDLNLITEIPDTGISVSWELDRYDVMDIKGKLQEEKLTEEGTNVRLTATLSCEEEREIREFYIRVFRL